MPNIFTKNVVYLRSGLVKVYSVLMPYPPKTDRQAVLDAAMDQVAEAGVGRLAIRGVAAALGVTPSALYRYFADLAALQAALADESRRRLLEALRIAAGKKGPEAALRGIARGYVKFAREQPHVFALTLLPAAPDEGGEAVHVQSWTFVLEHVTRLYGNERAPEAAVVLWAFLHGITVLEAAGAFGARKPASSFDLGLQMWLSAAGDTD